MMWRRRESLWGTTQTSTDGSLLGSGHEVTATMVEGAGSRLELYETGA